ncbi:hypothetical protein HF1_01540 [Mycoplasma haemofelis str. Langford 1]|uniref:Uncharacterized protein n=2 Tax=Mycoplasma haemofelis TaxID=29501 RepID=F6FG09_MYCHI|nr:hypothetical protein [Mycoplasma haemofelis]AEG72475.1 hypothetical protein MHF_0174 [Mycoplasma haemofelis Ohio2]CBY92162.1 hypothetical protein HF1_01540 [Mycoplasma haemofelis str. Langford 1]
MSLPSAAKKVIPVVVGASGIAGFTLFKGASSEAKVTTAMTAESPPVMTQAKGKSIGDAIKEANKKLLTSSSSNNAWEIRRRQYQTKFNKWITRDVMEEWCANSLNKDYQEKLFNDISQMCSVPNMKEMFAMKNKVVIDVTKFHDQRWATKVSNYVGKLHNKKMPNSELKNANSGVTPEVIMNWCKGGLEEEFIDENDRYHLIETWCVA